MELSHSAWYTLDLFILANHQSGNDMNFSEISRRIRRSCTREAFQRKISLVSTSANIINANFFMQKIIVNHCNTQKICTYLFKTPINKTS